MKKKKKDAERRGAPRRGANVSKDSLKKRPRDARDVIAQTGAEFPV